MRRAWDLWAAESYCSASLAAKDTASQVHNKLDGEDHEVLCESLLHAVAVA
jgi:hypothetical protein